MGGIAGFLQAKNHDKYAYLGFERLEKSYQVTGSDPNAQRNIKK